MLICAFSGGGRFCSRNGYVHPGRSTLLSDRLIMDARAWCLQNSWIFRYTSGVLCSPPTECPERKGGLFFQGLKSFCSSKGLDCQKVCYALILWTYLKLRVIFGWNKSWVLIWRLKVFFLLMTFWCFVYIGCWRATFVPCLFCVLRHQRCHHVCQVKNVLTSYSYQLDIAWLIEVLGQLLFDRTRSQDRIFYHC